MDEPGRGDTPKARPESEIERVAESFMVSFLARVPLPGDADGWRIRIRELSIQAHRAAEIFIDERNELRGETS